MSTHELYAKEPGETLWQVPASGAARFSWEYDEGRDRLLALYQKGKDKQWDGQKRIDWDLEVDPCDPLGTPDEAVTLYGTPYWARMTDSDKGELRKHYASWQFSQFLHGEQGAMVCAARIVESVPDLDAKFYSATQTMDEARHAEIYGRFLHEKIGWSTRSTTTSSPCSATPSGTAAGTCRTWVCRCSSRAWRWRPSA